MGIRNAMVDSKIKAFGFIPAAVGALWKVGAFICLEAPKKTLNFCIQTQKQLLYMPFRCVNGFYNLIRRYLKPNVPVKPNPNACMNGGVNIRSEHENKTLDAITLLTGGDKSPDKIISEMKSLTRSSLKAISRMEFPNTQSRTSKKKNDKRKIDNGRKGEEIFKIAAEEKELITAITAALKYFKSLKRKREKLGGSFCENQKKFFTSRVATAKKLLEYNQLHDVQNEMVLDMKEKYSKLADLLGKTKAMESNIESCLNHLNPDSCNVAPSSEITGQIVLNDSLEILQGIAGIVSEENAALRLRLAITNEKLEDVLNSSNALMEELIKLSDQFGKMSSVNKEMTDLQVQLDKARELLHAVEADRDEMRIKLMTLEKMIKEEEEFLDDNSCESGFVDYY